jgi:ADP-ribosylglycohydrolase
LIDPTSVAKAFAPNTSSSAAGTPTLSAHHPSTNISGANTSGGLFPDEALDDPDPLLHPQALSAASNLRSRFLGALIGLAVGDAVAAATQYRRPGTFTPVGDMLGGGPFDLPRGAWTDDTAMALCLADSLLERNGFDARDQMERYRRWQQQGYLSATGQCVGITASAARAIAMSQWRRQAFSGSHDPAQLDPETLSRVAPAVLFFFANSSQAVELAAEAARTTCQVPAVLDTCRSLARALHAALSGQPKATVLEQAALAGSAPTARNAPNVGSALSSRSTPNAGTAPGARSAPTAGSFPSARSAPNAGSAPATHSSPIAGSAPGIRSAPNAGSTTNADTAPAAAGSSAAGAVSAASSGSASAAIPGARPEVRVGTSAPAALAAAIAAFGATDNFRDAILYAANLGGDSDVVAAICGQLAGAYYGVKAIPAPWYNSLMHKDLIASYADRLLTHTLVGLAG